MKKIVFILIFVTLGIYVCAQVVVRFKPKNQPFSSKYTQPNATAIKNFKGHIILYDSLEYLETVKRLVLVEMNYEFGHDISALKEQLNVRQEKRDMIESLERQRLQILVYSLFLILFLAIAFAIYLLHKRKQAA